MPTSMKRRQVIRALTRNGATLARTTGGHDVWACPCGTHRCAVPRHTTISPGVVRSIEQQMACLPGGWLK